MLISITSKSKIIVIGCLLGVLHGCTTRTMTDDRINSVVKDNDGFRLVIGRKWMRIVEGGDWESDTVLKQKSEYYIVPLDFSKNEIRLEPQLTNIEHTETIYHPVKNGLLPFELNPDITADSLKRMNLEIFSVPNFYTGVGWDAKYFGRYGYVYSLYTDSKKELVQQKYSGGQCSVLLKNNWPHLRYDSSSDGLSLVVVERNVSETLGRISVYEQCKLMHSKEVDAQKINLENFYGFDIKNGAMWFLLKDQQFTKIYNSDFELKFNIDNDELTTNAYSKNDAPMHRPIFDAEAQKLYWFSRGRSHPQDNPNLQLVLTEYNLVTKVKKSLLLKLGGPFH